MAAPSDEIDKHVTKRYEIVQKLGKGACKLANGRSYARSKFSGSCTSSYSLLHLFTLTLFAPVLYNADGIVWRAFDKKTKDIVAVKKMLTPSRIRRMRSGRAAR